MIALQGGSPLKYRHVRAAVGSALGTPEGRQQRDVKVSTKLAADGAWRLAVVNVSSQASWQLMM